MLFRSWAATENISFTEITSKEGKIICEFKKHLSTKDCKVEFTFNKAIEAARSEDPDDLKKLTETTDINNIKNQRGKSLLYFFILKNEEQAIRNLVANGADVNIRGAHADHTPLVLALIASNSETIKCLVEIGADITLKDGSGATALDIAKRVRPDPDLLEILTPKT